jgi:WD40 repeat protein
MITGSTPGHIALWNLEKRRLLCQMRESHGGAVTGMKCLPSEPLMVTSSSDNSIKVSFAPLLHPHHYTEYWQLKKTLHPFLPILFYYIPVMTIHKLAKMAFKMWL